MSGKEEGTLSWILKAGQEVRVAHNVLGNELGAQVAKINHRKCAHRSAGGKL